MSSSETQDVLCFQLKKYSPKIEDAYMGAIHAFEAEHYTDRLVHFAHSLREVIDLLAKKSQTEKENMGGKRIKGLIRSIDPIGEQSYNFANMYDELKVQYHQLSGYAHHDHILEQEEAKERLAKIEDILLRLTRPQTQIIDEIDQVLKSKPTKEGLSQLNARLFRWTSRTYLLDHIPCTWLSLLVNDGFFNHIKLHPYPTLRYLARCVSSRRDIVYKIIYNYKFKKDNEYNAIIYDAFLKHSLTFAINNMEKIADKAICEKWYGLAGNDLITEKYIKLAEQLYRASKYDTALNLLKCILDHFSGTLNQMSKNTLLITTLNEQIIKFVKFNHLEIAKMLALFVDAQIEHDRPNGASDSSSLLFPSVKNDLEDYLTDNITCVCIVYLRDCFVHLGKTNPAELKKNMNILRARKSQIFIKLELFLYDKFSNIFKNKILELLIRSLHMQSNSEYRDLLNTLKKENKNQYKKLIRNYKIMNNPDTYIHMKDINNPMKTNGRSIKNTNELFESLKKYKPMPEVSSWENEKANLIRNYVSTNSEECSKRSIEIKNYDPNIQVVFLEALEESITKKTKLDWKSIITLVKCYVSDESPDEPYGLRLQSCRIIKKGLINRIIDFNLKDKIFDLIRQFIKLSNDSGGDDSYPNGTVDSLTISINDIKGLSFHMLFEYMRWREYSTDKVILTKDIKRILDGYADQRDVHNISQHAVIGLYYPTIHYMDSKWATRLICKIFSSRENKIAFWDSFVTYNNTSKDLLVDLHKLYDEFLNGRIISTIKEKRIYHDTIEHVILGYLEDIEYCNDIFCRFISKADDLSIKYCGDFITRVLRGNVNEQTSNKIIKLWKHKKFIDHAELYRWFLCKPFEKKDNIKLHLEYLENTSEKFIDTRLFIGLDDYVDEYPEMVARCIEVSIDKFNKNHITDIKKSTLSRLENKKIKKVNEICNSIREKLIELGQHKYLKR